MRAGEFRGKVITSLEFVEKEIKEIRDNHRGQINELKKANGSQNKRIVKLEKQWLKATSFATGVGAAAGFVANLIFK